MSVYKIYRMADLTEKIGWYINHPVMDFDTGLLLVGINTKISLPLIESLQKRGIEALQVSPEPVDIGMVAAKEGPEDLNERIARQSKRQLMGALTDIAKNIKDHKKLSRMKSSLSNEMLGKVESSIIGVIEAISNNPTSRFYLGMVEDNDPYLIHHSANVTYLAICLAQKSLHVRSLLRDPEKGILKFTLPHVNSSPLDLVPLGVAAMLHDIGKVFIMETVTRDKIYGQNDKEEWDLIRSHPKVGHDILFGKNVDSHSLLGVKYHHENYDGTGYPYGIDGNKIHIYARIIRVIDSFDAATSVRPGRGYPKSPEEVCIELLKAARTHYDPEICAHFVAMALDRKIPGQK